jgi:hypothetical protein
VVPTGTESKAYCRITGLIPQSAPGGAITITYEGNANASGTYPVRLWIERRDYKQIDTSKMSPAPLAANSSVPGEEGFYYTRVKQCNSINGAACNDSFQFAGLPAGNYVAHCDVPTAPVGKCTGNPACSYKGGSLPCTGFVSCASTDNATFNVATAAAGCNESCTMIQGQDMCDRSLGLVCTSGYFDSQGKPGNFCRNPSCAGDLSCRCGIPTGVPVPSLTPIPTATCNQNFSCNGLTLNNANGNITVKKGEIVNMTGTVSNWGIIYMSKVSSVGAQPSANSFAIGGASGAYYPKAAYQMNEVGVFAVELKSACNNQCSQLCTADGKLYQNQTNSCPGYYEPVSGRNCNSTNCIHWITVAEGAASSCKECPTTFECYKLNTGGEYRWFVPGYVMNGFVRDVDDNCTGSNVPKPTFKGKSKGDANCDGSIDVTDYAVWRREFVDLSAGVPEVSTNWDADFTGSDGKCDGVVNVFDYSLWHKYFSELMTSGGN